MRMNLVTLTSSAVESIPKNPSIEWTPEVQTIDYCIAVHATHGILPANTGARFLALGLRESKVRTSFTSLFREKHITKHYAVCFSRLTRELIHAVDKICEDAQHAAHNAVCQGVDFELHLLRTPIPSRDAQEAWTFNHTAGPFLALELLGLPCSTAGPRRGKQQNTPPFPALAWHQPRPH